jgi:predicted dehydrogenase
MIHTRASSRRTFLKTVTAAGVVGPALLVSRGPGADTKPNGRLTLGFIGVGTMGRGHLDAFLNRPDVQVVAVCDVVAERRDHAVRTVETRYAAEKGKGTYTGCPSYNDFRDLLARKDIDAVVIATPDHWHAIPCVEAARAGKHIYCEKPLTHHIAEGRIIVEAVRKHKVIFQTGSQQRSEFEGMFRRACELIRNGRIGQLKTIRIGVGGPPIPCDLPEQPVPRGTDWEMWLGPAPLRGYNEVLCPKGVHGHFPAWRNYREYAGGSLADMGAHHFDIAQWALAMSLSGPVKIEPPSSGAKTGLKFTYASGVEMFHGARTDCIFEGTDGVIEVSRGHLASKPESIVKTPLGPDEVRLYPSNNHRANWLECIRSGAEPICPAEVGQRSAAVCHLANIGYRLGRALTWDPARERFVENEEANKLLDREPRAPWRL